jgi:hypothetical protein
LAPVVDEPVRERSPLARGQERLEVTLDLVGIVVGRETEAAGKTADVRVDEDRRLAKCRAKDDVGGLPPDPGKGG